MRRLLVMALVCCSMVTLPACKRTADDPGAGNATSSDAGDPVRPRMTGVEAATLFWERVGRERRGRVCVVTPAVDCPREPVEVAVRTIGPLKVPTGRVIACDPTGAMFPEDTPPFARPFPAGEWPVELYAVGRASRVAGGTHLAAVVRAGSAAVSRWEPASPSRDAVRPNRWPGEGQWLVSVDGGIAAFVDQAGIAALGVAAEGSLRRLETRGPFSLELDESANLPLESDPKSNAVIFGAGVGDGAYPCFMGLSAGGEPAALLMLFDTFDADRTDAATK